jgi:hypothetical protein
MELRNEEILKKKLENLPSTIEFLEIIRNKNIGDNKVIVPYLKTLHQIIHDILPKPNKGKK